MKRSILIFIFCLIMTPVLAHGEDSFNKGVDAYKSHQYEDALKYFKKELQTDNISGEIAFNIGNCFYKLDEFGKAILWYKKAEKYMFSDPDLKFNIDQCYQKLSLDKDAGSLFLDKIFFLKSFLPESFINYLFLITEFILVFFILVFAGKKFLKVKLILSAVGCILFLNSCYNYLTYNYYKQGYIINDAKIHSAYSDKASILFTIPRGSKILVKQHKNGFYKIITNKGNPGWILEKNIGIL